MSAATPKSTAAIFVKGLMGCTILSSLAKVTCKERTAY